MRDARPTVVPSVRRKSTTGLTITAAEVVGGQGLEAGSVGRGGSRRPLRQSYEP